MMCFGVGALGPTFAGYLTTDHDTYAALAAVAIFAALVSLLLYLPKTSPAGAVR
jgi:hypothetical protein